MIHPTAVIDGQARLGAGVRIGPYVVIGPEVSVGDGTEIAPHVVLEGRVRIGARCRVGPGSVIGGVPQDLKFREGIPVGVRIGDDTVIREHVTIHRATKPDTDTLVGSHCLIMGACHIAHDCRVADHVIMINYAALTGHVTIEDHATIGGLTGVHPFTRVGAYAYIGGQSKVVQDVPPFVIVDGVPAAAHGVNVIGMRRNGIELASRRQVKAAFRILYRSGLGPGAAVARIKAELADDPTVARLVEFIGASRRGIVRAARAASEGDEEEIEA